MYVDGFVIPVPRDNKDAYTELARYAAAVFLDHGATRVVECWGDDVPDGVQTSFPMAVKLEEGEVACFAWIEYPDKATRDACHKATMEDPRMADPDRTKMPFDGKRLIFGGFVPVLDATR
jgi:uncharacterized protein YbaA (DUF1428 family)